MDVTGVISQTFLVKIGIATLVAIIIGIDREVKRKGIGPRTLIIITVASCLLTTVSLESSFLYAEKQIRVMDPARIPSYIISGIGFLGAGVILHKRNNAISGLTTAAMIWASAGLGIAIGLGFPFHAILVALVIVASVNFIPGVIKLVGPKSMRLRKVRIKVIVEEAGVSTNALKAMKETGLRLGHVKIKDLPENKTKQMDMSALVDEKRYITDVYDKIKEIEHVLKVEVEGL